MVRLVKQKFDHMTRFPTLSVRILGGTYLLTITVGLVTSRGLCGALFLGTSLFLRIECLCGPLSSIAPPYLLGLGFHADADAAGTH